MPSLNAFAGRILAAVSSLAISALVLSVTFVPVTQDIAHSGAFA